jgi:hypothetical protein
VLKVTDGKLVVEAQRSRAIEGLRALRQAFADSGISLDEFLESGREIREELFAEKYGHLLKAPRQGHAGERRREA